MVFKGRFRRSRRIPTHSLAMASTAVLLSLIIVLLSKACPAVHVPSRILLQSPASDSSSSSSSACGKVGSPCCPSNAKDAYGNTAWSCSDGSTCIYYQLGDNTKLSKCTSIDKSCGTGPGAACCPISYERGIMYYPPLPAPGCPDKMMCEVINAATKCVPQAPDCGKIGSKCCVQTSRVGVYVVCGPNGYCTSPAMAAYKGPGFGPVSTLMCEKCPGEKCDPSVEKSVGVTGHLDSLP